VHIADGSPEGGASEVVRRTEEPSGGPYDRSRQRGRPLKSPPERGRARAVKIDQDSEDDGGSISEPSGSA
jgi:hypothetical protein